MLVIERRMADSDQLLILIDATVAATLLGECIVAKMCEAFDPFPSIAHHRTQLCTDIQLQIRGVEMHKRSGDGTLQRIRYQFIREDEWQIATVVFADANYVTTSVDKWVLVVEVRDAAAKKRVKQLRFASPFLMEVEVFVVNSSVREHREKFALLMVNTAKALSSKKDRSGPVLGTKSVRVDLASKCGLRKLHQQQLEQVGKVNARLKKAVKRLQEMNPREIMETTDSHGLGVQADLYRRKDGEKVIQE